MWIHTSNWAKFSSIIEDKGSNIKNKNGNLYHKCYLQKMYVHTDHQQYIYKAYRKSKSQLSEQYLSQISFWLLYWSAFKKWRKVLKK